MQLHFKSFGSGEPMLIAHGMLGMLDNWQSFGKEMSQEYLVYLVDLRNHGKSEHTDIMNYPLMAEDLKETMEAQWMYDGAILVGHSMGGKTAMQLALNHPELVKALIVIDIAPIRYQGGHESILNALHRIDLYQATSRQEIFHQLQAMILDDNIVHFLMKNLSRSKDGSYGWKMNLSVIIDQYSNLLAPPEYTGSPYSGPVLFIRGGRSSYISSESEKTINEWFRNSKIETILDAGHWVHVDQPDELKNLMKEFLKNNIQA